MQAHPQTILQVTARTWNRDSHDLFDYEATNVARTLFMVQTSGRCVRTASRLNIITETQDVSDGEYLLRIIQREDKYWIMPPERLPGISTLKKVWMIVKNLPNNQHQLSEGDVIKLGRFRLRVRQICSSNASPIKLDDGEQPLLHEPLDPEKTQCRICLLEGGPHEEPLIAPCQCKGSIEYVHLGCLKHWIGAKQLTSNIDAPGCFYYKQPICELCRSVLPHSIKLENKETKIEETFSITSIPEVTSPYIVLESMAVQGHQQRGIHVLTMNGDRKHLKLGRGHESEIRIPDVSISRYHASLRMIDDKFYIEDHDSKFGTLVLIKKPISVPMDKSVVVQIGRTVVESQVYGLLDVNKNVIYNGICENIIKEEEEEMTDIQNDNAIMASLFINSQNNSELENSNQNNNNNNTQQNNI